MNLFGLIGYPLGHSFSEKFFTEKFQKEGIDAAYQLFPIDDIKLLPELIKENPTLCGLNVTIPYKEKVIPYLDELDNTAKEIGAVNVIKFIRTANNLKLVGYNSDVIGFENSLKPLLKAHHKKALILGTGGASKGVTFVLRKLGIEYMLVSRTADKKQFTYTDLNPNIIKEHTLIINASPVGTFPNIEKCPDIPYDAISENHLFYDLIYNPEKTLFLKNGEAKGATIKNGLEMLHIQALAAWKIWNK